MGDVNQNRRTMGDYYKRTDANQTSLGFVPANPVNFDIKGNVLAGLREKQYDGRSNKDPWDHLTHFSETCQIQKVPDNITEDQKRLRLFAFSLTGQAKDWLQ
ncbi:putative athila retroelement ORF1 protein, partial [Trifolium medium]|nr:putative athila retroelement ORF1 protein [Trifolium medium]